MNERERKKSYKVRILMKFFITERVQKNFVVNFMKEKKLLEERIMISQGQVEHKLLKC